MGASHPATLVSNFVYAATGALAGVDYGNGTTSTRSYTTGGLLKTLQHGTAANPGQLLDLEYDYQEGIANNGRIMAITDQNDSTKDQSYTYDGFWRLASAETSGIHWGLSWTYDRYGNRLSQSATKGTPPTQTLSVDTASNRVSTWSYDAAGNVLDDGNHTYAYDANNRQIDLDGGTAVYGYDAGGQRVTKIKNGVTTYQLSSGRYRVSGGWQQVFIMLGREKLAAYRNGTTEFFHVNHLGSPTKKTDLTGVEVASWENLPFGEEWSATGNMSRHRFTGHWRDGESDNDYAGARFYSNANGRWMGVDELRGHASYPQSLNRFGYAYNDPINYIDQDGRNPQGTQEQPTIGGGGAIPFGPFPVVGTVPQSGGNAGTGGGEEIQELEGGEQEEGEGGDDPFRRLRRILEDAFGEAMDLIRNNGDCSAWLGGNDAIDRVQALWDAGRIRIAELGRPSLEEGQGGPTAGVVGENFIYFNSEGPFWRPHRTRSENGHLENYRDSWNSNYNVRHSNEEFRQAVFIHEFAHFLNLEGFLPDAGDRGQARRNNRALIQHCF